jgi:hypothetical protein
MPEKNLPIKIFEKRKNIDDRLTEGGGNGVPPKWVLQDEDALVVKSVQLLSSIHHMQQDLTGRFEKYENVPAVMTARIIDDALAKSHRSDFVKALSPSRQDRLIGFSDNSELLIKVEEPKQLVEIDKQLRAVERNAKAISGVESINLFEPKIEVEGTLMDKDGRYVLKVRLFNFKNRQQNQNVLLKFIDVLSRNSHFNFVRQVQYAEGLDILHITTDSLEAIDDISDFSAIQSIQSMPTVEVVLDDFLNVEPVTVPVPVNGVSYPIIGILDTGIAPIPQLTPWITGGRHTNYPPHFLDETHGTFVSAIACFGDSLQGQDYTGVNGCMLLDAAVYPNPKMESVHEDDLVDNVREAIKKYASSVKVWNLSLGSKDESKVDDFSDFAAALDDIQDTYNVLIIKSAGNCRNFLGGMPPSRIANGADSVRSLTVGSIVHEQPYADMAHPDHLSPFSRVGPGPANIVKPDLVHYGGNAGVRDGHIVEHGVKSLAKDGVVYSKSGTSFAAPRVSALVADLENKLSEDFDPILLKALLIHSAKYPDNCTLTINEKLNQLGFGIPDVADEILYNDPSEITLLLRDSLDKGEYVDIIDFPYPDSLIDNNGYYRGQVVVTLVHHPILKTGQASEYCQSNVEVKFGTYGAKAQRNLSKRTIRNPVGRADPLNVLLSSKYSKINQNSETGSWGTERMLVQYGKKYYPCKKYAVDLSELTQTNKEKHIRAPRKWFLKVEGLYRAFVEELAEIERMDLCQEYCVIISIRDPQKKVRVYDEVTQQLSANNFIHRNISVAQRVNVRLPGDLK